jgi:protein TonB
VTARGGPTRFGSEVFDDGACDMPLAALAIWAATAAASGAASSDVTPVWTYRPLETLDIQDYPAAADRQHLAGHATIRCRVTERLLTACEVKDESPSGLGFGAAAIRLARAYEMMPREADGTPVNGRMVDVRIEFTPPNWARIVDEPPARDGAARPQGLVRWISGEFVSPTYPYQTRSKGVAGEAVLHCRVKADGSLHDCAVASEAPEGLGFGKAAINAARTMRVARQALDGSPMDGRSIELRVVSNPPCDPIRGCPPPAR